MSEQKRPSTAMVVATISSPEFKAKVATSLPKGIDLDRFTRMTMTAIQSKPELLEADKDSLYLAILQCAQTGLSPDGKESALVVFNTKVGNNQWVKKVQFMPMVTGIIKKLGEVGVKCDTNVVYENDLFDYEAGDDERITHKPAKLGTDRGLMIGCYAILRVQGIDTPYREVMSSADVEAVRRQSRAPDSLMWTQFASEGYRKTVLRRCAKRIPMKFEESLEATLNADNETFDMTPQAATEAAPAAAEAPQPAQIEQVNQQTDDRVVASQTPPEAAKRSRKTPAPAAPEPVAAAEESENPAPREERRAPEPAAPAPAAANTRAPAQPARPAALAAVVDATDDNEDIF